MAIAAQMVVLASIAVTDAASAASMRPVVSSLSVTSGKTAGGTRVIVHGSGFVGVTAVRFGDKAGLAVRTVSSKAVAVTSPAHAANLVNVVVVTRSGASKTNLANRFRFVAPPKVTSVTPTSGTPGAATRVTVRGSNFLKATRVSFGGASGTSLVVTSTTIQVTAPARPAQTVDVQVSTPYGTSAKVPADRYTFRAAPAAVSDLAVSAKTTTSTTLSWRAPPASAGRDIVIRRASGTVAPTSSSGVSVATLPSTATTYVDQGTTPATTYSYTVFGHAADAYSAPATVTVTTPSGPTWHTPQATNRANDTNFRWSSCPTAQFCMVVDGFGNYQYFDGTTWTRPVRVDDSPAGFTALSCASPTSCMAIDVARRWTQWNGTSWTVPAVLDSVQRGTAQDAVSCSSATFCARTSNNGTAAVFDGRTWTPPVVLPKSSTLNRGEPLTMTCLSGTFCMEMDTAGNTATYDGRAWHGISNTDSFGDFNIPRDLSCGTPSFCMAIRGNRTWTFDGAAWHDGPVIEKPGAVFEGNSVACVADDYCLAVAADGQTQIFDGTNWTYQTTVRVNDPGVTCPTASTCFMGRIRAHPGDYAPTISYDPHTQDVSDLPRFPFQGGYGSVSCSSTTFCQLVDAEGNSRTYDGVAWSAPSSNPLGGDPAGIGLNRTGNPGILSCTSSDFCIAGGYLRVQDGTHDIHAVITRYDGTTWSPPTDVGLDRHHESISAISCVSATSCYATDIGTGVTQWDGTAWSPMQDVGNSSTKGFTGISCVGDGFCVAVDAFSAYTHRSASGWSGSTRLDVDGVLRSVSCASSTSCVAVTDAGGAVYFDGSTWSPEESVAPNHSFAAVSCTSATFCMAIDSGADAYTFDGSSWTSQTIDSVGRGLTSISCTSESFCMATDLDGNTIRFD